MKNRLFSKLKKTYTSEAPLSYWFSVSNVTQHALGKKKKKKKKWGEVVGPIFWTDDRFIVASLDNMVSVLSQSAESSTHGSSTQYRQWYN